MALGGSSALICGIPVEVTEEVGPQELAQLLQIQLPTAHQGMALI